MSSAAKPYQQRAQKRKKFEKTTDTLEAGRQAYTEFINKALDPAARPRLVKFPKKTKLNFPHKNVYVTNTTAPGSGGTTTNGSDNGPSSNNNTVVGKDGVEYMVQEEERVRRRQHLSNKFVAPFRGFVLYALKLRHPHLKKNPRRTGHYLDRAVQGFTQRLCQKTASYLTKSFKADERSVLCAAHEMIDEMRVPMYDDAHKFADGIDEVLQVVEKELDALNREKDDNKKNVRRAFIAKRLSQKFKEHIGLQPEGFNMYLNCVFPRSVMSIQKAARLLLNLVVSTFTYHLCSVFGRMYGSNDKDDAAYNLCHYYFTASSPVKKTCEYVKIKETQEAEAMRRLPLFEFMHRIWRIPQTVLPVRYIPTKKQRVNADAGKEAPSSTSVATSSTNTRKAAQKRSASAMAPPAEPPRGGGKRTRATH